MLSRLVATALLLSWLTVAAGSTGVASATSRALQESTPAAQTATEFTGAGEPNLGDDLNFNGPATGAASTASPTPAPATVPVPAPEVSEAPEAPEAPDASETAQAGGEEGAESKGEEGAESKGMEAEEEEEFSPEGVGVAYTLLGSLFFGMIILYLVNWWDDDVRRYSWMVISMTISIFCAVLMYGGTTKVIEKILKIGEETPTYLKMIFAYVLFVLWLVILQLATAFASGMLCCGINSDELDHEEWVVENGLRATHESPLPENSIRMKGWGLAIGMGDDGYPVFAKKRCLAKERIDRRMRCWATLISHTAGFAAISAGMYLQHMPPIADYWGLTLLATILHWIVLILLFHATVLGTIILKRLNRPEELIDMYQEQISDAEVDVCALAVSALIVQSIKYALSGVLSDEEGRQPFASIPETASGPLLLFGIGCAGLVVGIGMTVAASRRSAGGEEEEPTVVSKLIEVTQTVFTMTFSWCTLYSARWTFVALFKIGISPLKPGSMLIQVCLSVSVSMVAFAFTVFLDKIEDATKMMQSRRQTELLFKNVISSIGLAVGLTWEKCFDRSLEVAASQSDHPVLMEFVLSVFVVALIVPAWRRYILAKQIYYDEMKVDMTEEHFVRREREEQEASRLMTANTSGVSSCFSPFGR